jgi:lysophospholipase L1-like esterase
MRQHEANVALAKQGGIDLYFEGDASVERWSGAGKPVWDREFAGWRPANFAIPGDKTENVLWRLENGELAGVKATVFVLMIGANNQSADSPEQTAAGIAAILQTMRQADPAARILLLGILPRSTPDSRARKTNDAVDALIARFDDGKHVTFMNLGPKFTDSDGNLRPDLFDNSRTYLSEKGYEVWADAIKPVLAQWLR